MPPRTKAVCISLPDEVRHKLQELADDAGITRTAYIRQIILNYLREIKINPKKKI